MKRRHLVVLVSAVTLLTLAFIAAVTISVTVGTSAGREQIRNVVEQQVGGSINGRLHLGKVSGNVITGFAIDTFAIHDTSGSLLVATGRIVVDYDPRDLLDRRILLRNVRVTRPVIQLKQYVERDWNF